MKMRTDVSSGGIAVSGRTDTPAPAATRSAMSRMPSTSTATRSSTIPRRGPPARSRCAAGSRRAGARAACSASTSNGTGSGGSSVPGGREPDQRLVQEVLDREPLVAHRLGDHRLRELLGRAPRRAGARTHPRSRAARCRGHACAGPRRARARASGSRCRRCRSWRCRPGAPAARRRPRGAAASSRRIAAGVVEHDLPRLGRGRAGPAPGEERDAELGLELADLLGHVRLDRPQRVRGRGERPLLVDRDQGLEMAQLHCRLLLRSIRPAPGWSIGHAPRRIDHLILDRTYQSNLLDRSGP